MTWRCDNLIDGLVLNENTGAISGIPKELVSDFEIHVEAVVDLSSSNINTIITEKNIFIVVIQAEVISISIVEENLIVSSNQINPSGTWTKLPSLPAPIGETCSGIVENKNGETLLITFGEGDTRTFGWNMNKEKWEVLATRLYEGDHHACETWENKLYVFAGFESTNIVQIYDPLDEEWSTGAKIPIKRGSPSTALIKDMVYLCSGIDGSSTEDSCEKYNLREDTWTSTGIKDMPFGRNHAAYNSYDNKLWVLGGRGCCGSGNGNKVDAGFDNIQVYDPLVNVWKTEENSSLKALPVGRGGMGRLAVCENKLYVIGGETNQKKNTKNKINSLKTFYRVDVYDPETNIWSQGTDMPIGMHGHYPVVFENKIWIAGGGVKAANSQSEHFFSYKC
jgi:N-acetylneuraminic acid mutarotase